MPYQIKNGIVYGSNAVSLTQAQYDALSTAEKNNGTVYYIYDSDAVLDASDVSLGSGTVEGLAGSVAVIETSPTTATHAVGSYIVYNGQLYEVTVAIAVGETLTVGTNISATTVGAELTSLNNDLTLKSKTYGTHGISVYRIGRIRVLKVTEPTGMSHAQNTWTDYATLDNKDIPLGTVDASIINNAAGQQSATPLQLRITTAGVVQVYNFTLSTLQAFGTVIYISKN